MLKNTLVGSSLQIGRSAFQSKVEFASRYAWCTSRIRVRSVAEPPSSWTLSGMSIPPVWPSGYEKRTHDFQELAQPVVVQPVAGTLDADDARVTEVRGAAVGRRIAGPALRAVEQQRRTRDAIPQGLDVATGHVVGRKRAHVVVELPGVGAVLVLVGAVHGEVARLLGGEVWILLLHAPERVLDARIAPRQPPRERALLADPLVHARVDRLGLSLGQPLGGRPEPLDGNEPRHAVRIEAGVPERDVAAERVPDDRHGRQPLPVDHWLSPWPRRSGAMMCQSSRSAAAVQSQLRQ